MAYADPADQKRAAQAHYQAHKDEYIARAAAARKKNRQENRGRLLIYLQAHPCSDCGEPDPVVLQFDHVGNDKTANVSRMIQQGGSWKKISQEIDKCEVVCANCHWRRTARRHGGWFKVLHGRVVESEDAPASNPGVLYDVRVRIPPRPLDPA